MFGVDGRKAEKVRGLAVKAAKSLGEVERLIPRAKPISLFSPAVEVGEIRFTRLPEAVLRETQELAPSELSEEDELALDPELLSPELHQLVELFGWELGRDVMVTVDGTVTIPRMAGGMLVWPACHDAVSRFVLAHELGHRADVHNRLGGEWTSANGVAVDARVGEVLEAALESGFQGRLPELRELASAHRKVVAAERGANAEALRRLPKRERAEFSRIAPVMIRNYLLTQQALDIACK